MTNFQTGLLNSAFWLVYAVFQIIGGIVADRWHPEKLVLIGIISATVANGLIYFCYENYILTLVIWMLNAVFQFGVWPSVFRMLSAMFSGTRLTVAMMIATVSTPLSTMMSYLVAAVIPRWQMNFVISTVILLVFSVIWAVIITLSGGYIRSLHLTKEKEEEKLVTDIAKKNAPEISTARLIILSGLILVCGICILRALIAYMPSMVPSIINSAYDSISPSTSTLIALIPLLCNAIGPVLSTLLSTKVKNEILTTAIIFSIILPAGLATLLLGQASYWIIIIAMAAIALGSSSTTFFVIMLLATKFNKWGKGATIIGLLNAFSAIGNVISSALMTWIADNYNWYSSLVALIIAIGLSLTLTVIEIPIWTKFKNKYYYEKA